MREFFVLASRTLAPDRHPLLTYIAVATRIMDSGPGCHCAVQPVISVTLCDPRAVVHDGDVSTPPGSHIVAVYPASRPSAISHTGVVELVWPCSSSAPLG